LLRSTKAKDFGQNAFDYDNHFNFSFDKLPADKRKIKFLGF
jgi:hypothetical protein